MFCRRLSFAALLCTAAVAEPAQAFSQESGASTQPPVNPLPEQAEGAIVDSVIVRFRDGPEGDSQALADAKTFAEALVGERFSSLLARRIATSMAASGKLVNVDYRLLPLANLPRVKVVFEADAAGEDVGAPLPEVKGIFSESGDSFPLLYQDGRSLYTLIIGGGLGVYSDDNPWFGEPLLFNRFNPLAGELPGSHTAWTEGSLELGIGGAAQIGGSNFYAFGALTGMRTWSVGQDVFTGEDRQFDAVEKAYVGILYANRESREKHKLSVGRQVYTLNDGFLINLVKGSSNAGERGATYLGPRLTNDFSVLANGQVGRFGYELFHIDPNEIEWLESESTFMGANFSYDLSADVSVDGTWITIPQSQSTYANPYGLTLEREGLNTFSGHVLWRNFGLDGLFLEGEIAHQSHPNYQMSTSAGYGTIGYIAREMPWTPSISWRYSYFSGDDPDTRTYERYDPLLNTGLGIWLQGVSFGKLTSNSNLVTHRIQFNVAPVEELNLTFDWHLLSAPELNNLGSNPALSMLRSHDLGQEFTLSARWSVTKNFYVQALASQAYPGEALREIGADEPWSTLQLSIYWGL